MIRYSTWTELYSTYWYFIEPTPLLSFWGMGHQTKSRQISLFKSNGRHELCHGGVLRRKRAGRGQRPLTSKDPIHFVFKINKNRLRRGSLRQAKEFQLVLFILKHYAARFHVKIEQCSVQNDHIHLLLRSGYRSQFHNFSRVVAGQIAQRFQQKDFLRRSSVCGGPLGYRLLHNQGPSTNHDQQSVTDTPGDAARSPQKKSTWIYRPFSRVVKGFKAYQIVRNYIQLNEKEARNQIPYKK